MKRITPNEEEVNEYSVISQLLMVDPKSIDGVSHYDNHFTSEEIEEAIEDHSVLNYIGFIDIFGNIIVSSEIIKYVANFIKIDYDTLYRFIVHHEHGHFKDLFNSEKLSKEDVIKKGYNKAEKENEIIADINAIRATKISLTDYIKIREGLNRFTSYVGVNLFTNKNAKAYLYDYKDVYNKAMDTKTKGV